MLINNICIESIFIFTFSMYISYILYLNQKIFKSHKYKYYLEYCKYNTVVNIKRNAQKLLSMNSLNLNHILSNLIFQALSKSYFITASQIIQIYRSLLLFLI